MDENSLYSILSHPFDNGFISFLIGVFFTLFVYSFSLYIQTKEKSYLFYSIYTLLIFLNQLSNDHTILSNYFISPFKAFSSSYHIPTVWLYNIIYFLFVFSFVNIKSKSKIWHRIIFQTNYTLLAITFITIGVYFFTNDKSVLYSVNKFIVPFLFIFGMVGYYPLIKYKLPLKNYIIIGSLVIYIASFFGFYGNKLHLFPEGYSFGQTIFLTGLFIENIIFSVALGRKQKLLSKEKEETQKELIFQLKENEKLRKKNQEILEKEVETHSAKAENEKIKKLEAEFESKILTLKMSSLRSQMNPHFIFNSLNSIKLYIIENEKNNAIYYLNKFSKLIRKILASTREETITLNEEIETVSLYTEIENIRFSNEIITSINVDENLNTNTIKIPSLILQPFIENAIWHGLSSKEGDKTLSVSFIKVDDDYLKIIIIDNGIGREKAAELKNNKVYKKDSIGIQLTEDRLKSFSTNFKGNYSIHIIDLFNSNNKPNGTQVEIKIPLV